MCSFYLISPGPRPPYYRIAEHLWGAGCDIDSDGDSDQPDATDWTELTIVLRSGGGDEPRVDIDPLDRPSLVLCVQSDDAALAEKAAEYLRKEAGGTLSRERPGT